MARTLNLRALERVLAALDAPRNGAALFALLATLCLAGLLLAMAESALAREASGLGSLWAGLALAATFFGINTTGLLLMDQARGRPVRDVEQAFTDALLNGHKVLLSLSIVLAVLALPTALMLGLLLMVKKPWIGAPLFGVLVPLGVAGSGLVALGVAAIVGPLTGPSVWAGSGAGATARMCWRQFRHGLVEAAALMSVVVALTGAVTAVIGFIVMTGARVMALLSVWWVGIDLPPQQLMAGLFGYGLRALGAAGAPVAASPLGAAALVGGGVVFALALALPTLVYLRGCCAVYLALADGKDNESSPSPWTSTSPWSP